MTRTELIQSVFEKYKSDKSEHGYAAFYAQHLPENPRSILEIGVKEGASIRAWKELFPEAEIWGLDLFREFPKPKIPYIRFVEGNQCDWEILEILRDQQFDVIIDDGSHNWRDQMITFYGLAHEGCKYFIEDTHCCNDESYSQGLPKKYNAKNFDVRYIPSQGGPEPSDAYTTQYRFGENGQVLSGIKLIEC